MIRLNVCDDFLKEIEIYLQSNSLAHRSHGNGNKRQQQIGLVGEILTEHYFLGTFPNLSERKLKFDGGYDFIYNGQKIDVKTMERKVDIRSNYVHNFFKVQEDFTCDIFIFNSFNSKKNILEICGWLPKKEFISKSILFNAGSIRIRADGTMFKLREDNYEIRNDKINSIELLKENK